jgi:putative ABC transport system permease protein
MFITYLLRELRRRMRQAIFIAAGLALGVGLVITVTAASDGVSATQGTVLRSLYGVGTDVTVTKSPTAGSGGGTRFNFGGGPPGQRNAGTSFSRDILAGGGMGTIKSSSVTTVSGLKDVSGAAGALVLNDVKLSGTVSAGGGQPGAQGGPGSGSINSSSFTVTGVDPAHDALGPLSSGTVTSGHDITTAESDSNVAVVDSNYAQAQNLKVGSNITVAGKTFSVIGIVQPAQGENSADVYIPLARAQTLANMPGEVNTIYVSAASAADISGVSGEISRALPTVTVTTSSNLASEVTGSLSSASTWPTAWASGWPSPCSPRRSAWPASSRCPRSRGGSGSSAPSRRWAGAAAASSARSWARRSSSASPAARRAWASATAPRPWLTLWRHR